MAGPDTSELLRRIEALQANLDEMDLRLTTTEILLEAFGSIEADGQPITIPDLLEKIREEWEARAAGGTEPPALFSSVTDTNRAPVEGE